MERPFFLPLLFLAIGFASPPVQAAEQGEQFIGHWQQIRSNAGKCDRCSLVIARSGSGLTIGANNGWSASAYHVEAGRPVHGYGFWSKSSNSLSDTRFQASFSMIDDRLHMEMNRIDRDGKSRSIRAIYERR